MPSRGQEHFAASGRFARSFQTHAGMRVTRALPATTNCSCAAPPIYEMASNVFIGTAPATDWKDAPWLTYINILCLTQKLMDDPLENDGRDTGRNDRSRGQALSGSAGKSGSSPFNSPLAPAALARRPWSRRAQPTPCRCWAAPA